MTILNETLPCTSSYQNQQQKGAEVGNQIQQVYSMSGNYLDSKEFKHNNMVPFNGGKIRGNKYDMAFTTIPNPFFKKKKSNIFEFPRYDTNDFKVWS